MHERLRAHAESVAFFGGGYREKAVSFLLIIMSLYEPSYLYLFLYFFLIYIDIDHVTGLSYSVKDIQSGTENINVDKKKTSKCSHY